MTAEKTHEEVWTYVGRRLGKGQKLVYGWLRPDGQVYHYKSRGASVPIGRQVIVTVDEDGSYFTAGDKGPKVAELDPDAPVDIRIVDWQAADMAASTEKDRVSSIRAASKSNPVEDLTVGELFRQARRLPAHQRRALLAWFADEVWA